MRPLLLVLLALAGLLPGLGVFTPERQQELRVALVARNMAEGGSWLIPEFQRQPRLRKPPLSYWLTAAACRATGTTRSIAVMRLPSVLAGIGLLFAVWGAGRRLLDDEPAAFGAAVLCGFSFAFLRHAGLGETDLTLSLCIVLAVWAAAHTAERGLPAWAACGLFAGLGFLAKGPAAAVIPPLAIAAAARWRPERIALRRGAGPLLALAGFAAMAAPWYAVIWALPEAREAIANEGEALLGKNRHTGTVLYYLYTAPVQLLPWGVLLPVAAWLGRGRSPAVLAWFLGVLVLLSLLPSKQAHYAVLLLAPGALLTAGWRCPAWLVDRRVLGGAVAGLAALSSLYALVLYPRTNPLHRVAGFMAEARPALAAAPLVHVVGINSAIFEFHHGEVVHNIDSARAAWNRAGPGDAIVVIQDRDDFDAPDLEPAVREDHGEVAYRLFVKP